MMPYEKDKLLALLESDERWCQDVEARDLGGDPVKYNDAIGLPHISALDSNNNLT